jgi:predicted DNA-binding protein with PD1-like motif
MIFYPIRLAPGLDPYMFLENWVNKEKIDAAVVLSCLGSLTEASVRFANQPEQTLMKGPFEILSLTGFMSIHGSHYHIGLSDETGISRGGHLMAGSKVYTTVEMLIGIMDDYKFLRTMDPQSGFEELDIKKI